MAKLRAPDGCPWDRKQTHDSLKPYLLEETYEVLETIDKQDDGKLREELGDLLLQILFHAQIAAERQAFSIEDVMQLLADKLVRRHPHVFGPKGGGALTPDQVYTNWEQIKKSERQQTGRSESVLDGVPKTLPALLRAFQIQARASRVGFDWPQNGEGVHQVMGKVKEEIEELTEAYVARNDQAGDAERSAAQRHLEDEMGDVLFSLVNLARFLKFNPEDALRRATDRFADRFHFIEAEAARTGRTLDSMTLDEMDALWKKAKAREV
ncbi:MAG: nucleoside triphosphate pyrophosphohydrolase [Nitrospirae bacterium RIFCSPLOWO2_02_FULL_62_14]|nr:MAG: nucleoside triphosphate pyrophosphohydrolase [Nitrospirae bacterium RIFCSPLOWO2_02_FULL_62_14]